VALYDVFGQFRAIGMPLGFIRVRLYVSVASRNVVIVNNTEKILNLCGICIFLEIFNVSVMRPR
jgi:hypothetical protein